MKTKKDPATGLKSGLRSSEFYLSLAAMILGIVVSTGIADPEGLGTWDKIAGIACSLLAAFGYTVGRSKVKAAAEESK